MWGFFYEGWCWVSSNLKEVVFFLSNGIGKGSPSPIVSSDHFVEFILKIRRPLVFLEQGSAHTKQTTKKTNMRRRIEAVQRIDLEFDLQTEEWGNRKKHIYM